MGVGIPATTAEKRSSREGGREGEREREEEDGGRECLTKKKGWREREKEKARSER